MPESHSARVRPAADRDRRLRAPFARRDPLALVISAAARLLNQRCGRRARHGSRRGRRSRRRRCPTRSPTPRRSARRRRRDRTAVAMSPMRADPSPRSTSSVSIVDVDHLAPFALEQHPGAAARRRQHRRRNPVGGTRSDRREAVARRRSRGRGTSSPAEGRARVRRRRRKGRCRRRRSRTAPDRSEPLARGCRRSWPRCAGTVPRLRAPPRQRPPRGTRPARPRRPRGRRRRDATRDPRCARDPRPRHPVPPIRDPASPRGWRRSGAARCRP